MKKQLWTGAITLIGMLILIFDSRTALEGARNGLELCIRTVIPSLFPFFVLSALLTGSLMGMQLAILRPLGKLFQLPAGIETILIPAFLGGYPVGAQAVTQAYRAGQLDRQSAERMLAFCSNAGPAFLFGLVGSLFSRKWMVWLLWAIHIFSAWMVSLIFPCQSSTGTFGGEKKNNSANILNTSLKTMAQVCGWVILFRVMISFLERWVLWLLPQEWQVAVIGILELSNGCCELFSVSEESVRFLICSGILAFGGVCVTMQTVSVTQGLSMQYYLLGKLMQSFFSLVLSAAVCCGCWYLAAAILGIFLILPIKKQKKCGIPRKAVV